MSRMEVYKVNGEFIVLNEDHYDTYASAPLKGQAAYFPNAGAALADYGRVIDGFRNVPGAFKARGEVEIVVNIHASPELIRKHRFTPYEG